MKKRSKHSLSHYNLLTTSMGIITPIECIDILPGDSILQNNSVFLRTMPLVAPVMHPVRVEVRSFFVPLRIIWDDFQNFITGGPDGLDATVHPFVTASSENVKEGELLDYLSVPPSTLAGTHINVLQARAYAAIYNEYFRDQDLEEEVPLSTASGEDTTTSLVLQRASWQKDYFTLARPFEQKGVAASVPISSSGGAITGMTADTKIYAVSPFTLGGRDFSLVRNAFGDEVQYEWRSTANSPSAPSACYSSGLAAKTTVSGNASFDLGSMSISDFREAMAIQRFQEVRGLYGSRYEDYQAFLGVKSSDARLQHPEYLGGGQRTIQFSEVLQTSEGTEPVGTLRGHGIGALKTRSFMRFFNEHGILMSLMIVRPISIYTQGLHRSFSRQTKYDYWQKEYEHIGQQALLNKELYAGSADGDGVFGYTNRYNEYRYHPNQVHGEFRSYYEDWHLGRKFSAQPVLNKDFISCRPDNRIFAVTSDNYDKLLIMAQNSIRARRLISQVGDPI